jgi:negative regulator of sigma-B (phosphoserine phosphatase)
VATIGESALAEWGVAMRPMPGQDVSGDRHVTASARHGLTVAVIDGLGHGPQAAYAADRAAEVIEAHPDARPEDLIRLCHEALLRTRGAAITIASIDGEAGELAWLGVGNVQATVLQSEVADGSGREWVPLRGGVVGYALPALRSGRVRVRPDDVLVFATDGVRPVFGDWPHPSEAPDDIAARLLAEQGRQHDDALVLVARYRGGAPTNTA